MRTVDVLLQRLEVGETGRQDEGDLAVDQRALCGKGEQRLGNRREAHGPIETAPAEQRDLVICLPPDDAVAVIFRFVQPAAARGHVGVEGGKLRLYELWNRN